MEQQHEIRVGIVSIEPHAPSWVTLLQKTPGIEVACVWDYQEENARRFAEEYAIPAVAPHPEDMLDVVTAVAIAGGRPAPKRGEAWGEAPDDHLRLSRPFLSEGLPVLIDKPLADTVEDAVEIVRLARGTGAPLMSASAIRYAPEVATLHELANDGSLGKLVAIDAAIGTGVSTLRWYSIHIVDALSHIFGPGIESVFAIPGGGTLDIWDRQFPHAHGLVMRWDDGRLATVLLLRDLADAASNNPLPERATKLLDPTPTEVPPYIANHIRIAVYGEADWTAAQLKGKGSYTHQLQAFVDMARTGEEPIPLEQTLETIQAINAAERSAETRQLERLTPVSELLDWQ